MINRAEKNHLLFLNSMVHKSNHLEDEAMKGAYSSTPEGKRFLQNLRTGRTWLQKALAVRIEPLDFETKKWLERTSLIMQLNFSYVKDADRIMKKFLEEDREMREQIARDAGADPLYILSEFAMAQACTGCDGSPRQTPDGCPMHDVLRLFMVPELDDEDPRCGYINDVHPAAVTRAAEVDQLQRLTTERDELKVQVQNLSESLSDLEKAHEELLRKAEVDRETLQTQLDEANARESQLEETNDLLEQAIQLFEIERKDLHDNFTASKAAQEETSRQLDEALRGRAQWEEEALRLQAKDSNINQAMSSFFTGLDTLRGFMSPEVADPAAEPPLEDARAIEPVSTANDTGFSSISDPNYARGIKLGPGGKKFYRTGYDCPKCLESGYRYNDASNKFTKCRSCRTKIAIAAANPDGFPNRDEETGDFLYGNTEFKG